VISRVDVFAAIVKNRVLAKRNRGLVVDEQLHQRSFLIQ
jgi:hypothetical protein